MIQLSTIDWIFLLSERNHAVAFYIPREEEEDKEGMQKVRPQLS